MSKREPYEKPASFARILEAGIAAAMRHLAAWRDGEQLDEESGLPHLAHALCCIVFLRELDRAGLG